MQLFFQADFTAQSIVLNEEESHHAIKVLRLSKEATLHLTNGKGDLFELQITEAHQKYCKVQIIKQLHHQPKPYYIHLAIAPTKNIDRMEWLVEKLVEIGVQAISFVLCERSERKIINIERIQKIAVSALKQSLQTHLPIIEPLTPFKQWLTQVQDYPQKMMAYLSQEPTPLLKDFVKPNQKYALLIGPEGDFSPTEVHLAQQHGFKLTNLGENRLRTETAGLLACLMCLWKQ